MQTIGDVIDAINNNTMGIQAAINSAGDGIVLQDKAGGTGTLGVSEGSSTTARDLHLLGQETSVGGVQTIDGTTTQTIALGSTDTLTDLANDINNRSAGLSAQIINDGSSTPYHLSLTATRSGAAGNMIVDASQFGALSLERMTRGQNALLALGAASSGSAPVVVSSSTNTFTNVISGASLQIVAATGQPVTVTVANDGSNISSQLQSFVKDYNSFQSQYSTDTEYNTTTQTGAVLNEDPAALAVGAAMAQMLTTQFLAGGPVRSLADLGISVGSDGTLSFNQSQFQTAWADNPQAVQQLFTTKNTGVVRPDREPDQQPCRRAQIAVDGTEQRLAVGNHHEPGRDHPDEPAAQRRAEPPLHGVLQHGPRRRQVQERGDHHRQHLAHRSVHRRVERHQHGPGVTIGLQT